jgi:SAM-dependent methyltransferase
VKRLRHKVETVTSEVELENRLKKAEELLNQNDDEGRQFLASFELAPPEMPSDPFSPEYHGAQIDLYRRISQRDEYQVAAERSFFDMPAALRHPYPYSTESAVQVADQLAAYSFIIRTLPLRPGCRVIEFGPGWGNLTLQLAMMSIHTTAVDVNPLFVELLRARAESNAHLEVVESDMLAFKSSQVYDAAIFFESFHHCSDHLEMLRHLQAIVAEDGVVAFAGEPLGWMPYPWGLRLDGMSLYSTWQYGWLELGFRRRYFAEALKRTGWTGERVHSRSMSPLADVLLARRVPAGVSPLEGGLHGLRG